MKTRKIIVILSLTAGIGTPLVSLGGGAGRAASKAIVPITRAGTRTMQPVSGLRRAGEVAVGTAGAVGTTLVVTGSLSEKPDMPKPGYEQDQEPAVLDTDTSAGLGQDIGEQPGDTQGGQAGSPQLMSGSFGGSGGAGLPSEPREKDPLDLFVEAIKKHDVAQVQKFIAAGIPVNIKDYYGSLPLAVAIRLGFVDIMSMLLDAGAQVDLVDRSVIESADWWVKNILQFARDMQAELRSVINDQDQFGQTMLMQAVTQNDKEKVKRYIQFGADIDLADINGNTPLLRALILGNMEVAEILLEAGADITKANKSGDTPKQLMFHSLINEAIERGDTRAVAAWVAESKKSGTDIFQGIDLNKVVMGSTPLIAAIERGTPAVVQILLDAGVDVNQDINGLTPIRIAIESNKVESAQLLLRAGVDPNQTVENGVPLLILASAMGLPDMVRVLLAAGADKDTQVNGFTALDVARQMGHTAVVELLEKAGGEQMQEAGEESNK